VCWQADALQLPFEDASFDVVCCQFGAMFFADRVAAYAEAHRVLKPGGGGSSASGTASRRTTSPTT
jgi:ubiquinone/menaquinone biosynthesis C-methylase UbiE